MLRWCLSLLLLARCPYLCAQSTTVIDLGITTTQQVANGLGFHILESGANGEWEYAAVAASGAQWFRAQPCSWSAVGQQSPAPNDSPLQPAFKLNPECSSMLAFAAKYKLHPINVAAYGPPAHPLLQLSLASPANVGDTALSITFSSGANGATLHQLRPYYDYISNLKTGNFIRNATGIGALVAGVRFTDSTHATVLLASAVENAQPAGVTLNIMESLYPSAATERPDDPSVVAYSRYVAFLAQAMHNAGVAGAIEIWNEPPWNSSRWGCRSCMYDYADAGEFSAAMKYPNNVVITQKGKAYFSLIANNQGNSPATSPNAWTPTIPQDAYTTATESGYQFGFAASLQNMQLPPGITLIWGGTNKGAGGSLLNSRMQSYSGAALQEPVRNFTSQAIHPYADSYNNPEGKAWLRPCIVQVAAGQRHNCPGFDNSGANFWQMDVESLQAKNTNSAYGLGISITETNQLMPRQGELLQHARAAMRQFLAFSVDGVAPIIFFDLCYGNSDQDFGMVKTSSGHCGATGDAHTPKPAFSDLQDLISDLRPVSNPPVAPFTKGALATVGSYNGMYNLAAMHMVGSRRGAEANTDVYTLWQLTACQTAPNCWFDVPSPKGSVTINIPAGMTLTSAMDTVTRTAVRYAVSGRSMTLPVADNPIELIFDPVSSRPRI